MKGGDEEEGKTGGEEKTRGEDKTEEKTGGAEGKKTGGGRVDSVKIAYLCTISVNNAMTGCNLFY